jgi:two-component system response regulator LytT
MRVVIIEDEPLAASRLKMIFSEYDPAIDIVAVLESVEDAVQYFQQHVHPDLVLLDIELADGISFSIFSRVKVDCPVIFVTAYDKYAIDAFRLFSIDYLLKPVTQEALSRALHKFRTLAGFSLITQQISSVIRSIQQPGKTYRQKFLIKSGSRMFFIEAGSVAYFLSEGKTVFLITREGNRHIIDFTLEKLQEELDPGIFFRLNRSVICSIHAIKEIRSYFNSRLKISISAGSQTDEAIVSRERVNAFKSWAEG